VALTEERSYAAGLQAERTSLAWQRTLLSLGAALVGAGRVLLPVLGFLSYVLSGVGFMAVASLMVLIDRRYREAHRQLTTNDSASLPSGGRLILASAVLVFGCGIGVFAFVLSQAL
jgi:uncharacterized membrane protein YidH (DUF202 family)